MSHTKDIAYDIENASDNVTRDTFLMLLGVSATFSYKKSVLLTSIANEGPTDLHLYQSTDR